MTEIINIDDHRPHVAMGLVDGTVRVFPVQMIENWINGEIWPEDPEPLIRSIVKEWMNGIDIQGL